MTYFGLIPKHESKIEFSPVNVYKLKFTNRSQNMERKVALLTGGGTGLGQAFAKELALQEYEILLLGRTERSLRSTCELLQHTTKTRFFICDIRNFDNLTFVADELASSKTKINFLIINAGIVHVSLLKDKTPKDIVDELQTNLLGAIFTLKAFFPMLAPNAKVLFISSGYGLMAAAGYSVYCASKAGLVHFAEAFRREVKNLGIEVFVACPSYIDTPMLEYETESAPLWLKKNFSYYKKFASANKIAKIILKKCKKSNFLIFSSMDIAFGNFLVKCLPRKISMRILDKFFASPS